MRQRAASYAVMSARHADEEKRHRTDNNLAALSAKIDIRKAVLANVQPARVLDCFCGRGEMYRAVWREAAIYAGCDARPWKQTDPPRFVADNLRLLRALDLAQYNIFDMDAWGSPWGQMEIVLHRRQWSVAERGAVVITAGASGMGPLSKSLMRFLGITTPPRSVAAWLELHERALSVWLERSRVKPIKSWRATRPTNSGGKAGGDNMLYLGIVFEGA